MKDYIVYDFDGTIYDGDSSIDFFIFCLKRHPKAFAVLPKLILYTFRYLFKLCSKEELKEHFFAVVKYVPDINLEVSCFWEKHLNKIFNWYSIKEHTYDVIVSASPEFLLSPLLKNYNVLSVIATKVNPMTGKFLSPNCYGQEKITRLIQQFDNILIREFYFDSDSDLPLAALSICSYRVCDGKPQRTIVSKLQ